MTSKVPAICRAVSLAALCFAFAFSVAGQARAAAPTPTAADPGMPNSIAVLGDSMSVATGINVIPSVTQPESSWSTGTNSSVNSLYRRILALNPGINGKNRNKAANGEDMTDAPSQANATETDTELVTMQLGGNNLCKDSVAQMTSIADYRAKFVETLNILANRTPNALIQIQSVPDIYNLWFLRGAPNPPNDQPSSRAGTARVFWDTLAVIPCKSLVLDPTSMAQADIDRRDAVRARNIAYNQVLAEECEARLRCRFDRYATFNFSSNRTTPPYGPYLPRAQWEFVDDDISTVDHFHPGLSGQRKMAQAAWDSGYNYTDSTMPTSTVSISPGPLPSGTSFLPSTVNVAWTDAAGIKGVQYRTHFNGNTSAWQTEMGTTTGPVNVSASYGYLAQKSIAVNVNSPGVTYVESRAMDVNGNLSASRVTEVTFDPNAVPAPEIISGPATITASTSASFSFSGAPAGTSYECALDAAPFSACTSPISYSSLPDGARQFRVRLNTGAATGPADSFEWHIDSSAPPAPVIDEGPPVNTTSPVATFFFTGDPTLAYECSLDGGAFNSCTSPHALPALTNGSHHFEVRQRTIANTPGSSAIHNWVVDNVAPAAPVFGEVPSSPTNSTTAEIHFSGEPGGSFRCQLDGGTVNLCSSPRSIAGLGHGSHTLSVYQRDALNNQGPPAAFTWTVDLSAPPAPAINGGPSGLTSSRDATVTFSGEAGGHFECALDDASFFFCSSPYDLTGIEDGDHNLRIRQVDTAGNTGAASSRTWTVDGTGPDEPVLGGGPASPTASASAGFTFTGESGGAFQCSLDSADFSACTSPVNLTGLGSGAHEFRVRQVDDLGNIGGVASHSWTVDRTAPAAPELAPMTDDIKRELTQTIVFSGEPGGNFECRIGEGPWTACSSPWTVTFPGEGTHSFSIRQLDALGNTGSAVTGTMVIDLPDPTAPDPDPDPLPNPDPGPTPAPALAPKLTGKVKAKAKGTAVRGKTRTWVLTSRYDRSLPKPLRLEFSITKKKPSATATPVSTRSRKWKPKLKIKSKKKPVWVRVLGPAGTASGWYRVR